MLLNLENLFCLCHPDIVLEPFLFWEVPEQVVDCKEDEKALLSLCNMDWREKGVQAANEDGSHSTLFWLSTNSSLGVPGDSKGAIPDPLEPWGNADSTSPPGVSAASGTAVWTQASGQDGPKQHFESQHITSKPQQLLQICQAFWDRVQLGIPSATSTPLLQPQEDSAYEALDALQAHIFADSSRMLW